MSQKGLQGPRLTLFSRKKRLSSGKSGTGLTCSFQFTALCVFFLVTFTPNTWGQRVDDWRTNVDMLVERADSLSLKSQNTFYLNRIIKVDKTFKNDKTVRETWYYTISQNKIIIFQVRYLIDSSEFTETYYMDDGNLVCLEQYENNFFSPYDEVNWGKVLFFDRSIMKLNVTVGTRKSNNALATNASEAIEIFNRRYSELLRNMRLRRASS